MASSLGTAFQSPRRRRSVDERRGGARRRAGLDRGLQAPVRAAAQNAEAIDLYLRGLHELGRTWYGEAYRAVALFEQALALSPISVAAVGVCRRPPHASAKARGKRRERLPSAPSRWRRDWASPGWRARACRCRPGSPPSGAQHPQRAGASPESWARARSGRHLAARGGRSPRCDGAARAGV